jgi:UTP:GlnB (protein PII) uridylyltransferase
VLSQYSLDGSTDVGPALYLEVRGPDRLGFLGSLLRSLARLELAPREMHITTSGGEAFDSFYLKTLSGAVPPEAARRALAAGLEAALVARHPSAHPVVGAVS